MTTQSDPNFLDFEQPIAELQAKIKELRFVGSDNAINLEEEIERLEEKLASKTEQIFGSLSSWQISQLARHPRRPYTLDYIKTKPPTSSMASLLNRTRDQRAVPLLLKQLLFGKVSFSCLLF